MNKKVLSLLLLPLLVSACSGGGSNNSGSGSTPEDPEIINIDTNEYDDWANSWSKPGHLYFHYNRGDKKGYENYCLWLWQFYPEDSEGALWGFSGNTDINPNQPLRPMSTSFMTFEDVGKGSEGSGTFVDNFGVIFDVDYTSTNLKGGKTGSQVSYVGASELGFLIPKQDSMDGHTHWESDGGANNYITGVEEESGNWRDVNGGKALHIFVATGSLYEYSFFATSATPQAKTNPVTEDTTGQYSSAIDTTYNPHYGNSSTSNAFKQKGDAGVGYQIFVASFRDSDGDGRGDLRGIINALDEGFFDDLNIDVLWLTPIQKSDSYHGYDISDYYAVDKKFGTIQDYQELIYKAHQHHMKVLMDLVLNHTSKSNKWFINSQWAVEDQDFKWRDVYTWKFENEYIDKWNHKTNQYEKVTVKQDAESDNPSWYKDGESHYYYYGKFGSGMPEINYLSEATRKLVINMARYWLSFGLDGFRLDAVKHIFMRDECFGTNDVIIQDTGEKTAYDDELGKEVTRSFDYSSNLTKNVGWWKEFAHGVKDAYPNCFLVGENFDGWGKRAAQYYQALDSQFSFSHYYHIPAYLWTSGGTPANFVTKQAGESYDIYAGNGSYLLDGSDIYVEGGKRKDFIDGPFTSNHDVMRAINQANGDGTIDGTTPKAKVTGEDYEIKKAKIHAAITLLSQGLSWIYYGDELGMSSNTEQHLSMYGNENSIDIWYRQPYLWANTAIRPAYKAGQYYFGDKGADGKYGYDSYNTKVKNLSEQKSDPNSMYNWYKALGALKNEYPTGHKIEYVASGTNVLVIKVTGENVADKPIVVYINTYGTSDYDMHPSDFIGSSYDNIAHLGIDEHDMNIGAAECAISAFRAN